MHIHLGRVAFGVGESDLVALLHQGANRNRQFVEVVAGAGINLAILQGQTATARDQYQDLSFDCHFVLLSEIGTKTGPSRLTYLMTAEIRTSTTTDWLPKTGIAPSSDRTAAGRTSRSSATDRSPAGKVWCPG